MKAVLIDIAGSVAIMEVPRPDPQEGEVLVRLRCCGVCGTDLEKIHGQGITSRVLGHEEVGEVAAVGRGVARVTVGERVYAHHHVGCGECSLCRSGEQTLCPEYSRHNLVPCGLAEYFIVPRYNVERGAVLRLPDRLAFEEASFIEPLACCIRALRRSDAYKASSVLIYGAGPVGLLHLKLLRAYGVKKAVVADVSRYRLEIAETMGADETFDASDPAAKARALLDLPRGPDLAILATGSTVAFEDAVATVSRGGTVLLFGAPKKGARATVALDDLFLKAAKIVPSYAATETETAEAMDLLASGRITVSDMITHTFPLARATEAFAVADQQQCLKALITSDT